MSTEPRTGAAKALSVSAALALAKGELEGIVVKILGEVSEVSDKPGYKAVYFTVKDEGASLPCMMWNNRYAASGVKLSVGALVEVSGRFTLYAPKGRMNFDVFSVALAGEGNLRLKVAERARRLEAEGLFAAERKRPLPRFPQVIGLVTSPRGAAVHDVLRTLRRRYPLAEVVLAGVPVEGQGAPEALSEGVRAVVAAGADVVLLVRGGGSFEDLMPFNDETLARCVAASPVPVVTGIGHEPDTSIADMAADVRASTPTAAAEAVSAGGVELAAVLPSLARRIRMGMDAVLASCASRLAVLAARPALSDPARLFAEEAQTLDDLSDRLSRVLPGRIAAMRGELEHATRSLCRSAPAATERRRAWLEERRRRMLVAGEATERRFQSGVALAASRLHDLSPLAVIARGYSMVQDGAGGVVTSVSQVEFGERLNVTVTDGVIACEVLHATNVDVSFEVMEDDDGRAG